MTFIAIRHVGEGGIVTDQNPYDLELTQFPDGNNLLFHDGRIGKALGYTSRVSVPQTPTHVQGWFQTGNHSLICGTLQKLYRYNGMTLTNVTKTSDSTNYSMSPRWQSEQMGNVMLFNNGGHAPQYMQPDGARFADLPNWPSGLVTNCIKPYRGFLVMAGYEEGSSKFPYTVRWSDSYDPTTVPTDYSLTSTTNLAGENRLTGSLGELIDQLALNNSQIIYAERGVFAMDFVGLPFVFTFREVFADDGIINRGAVAEFYNKHLVVGQNDIYIHDGNQKQSIADKRVRKTFYNSVADTRSVFCQTITERSEIWICYSDVDAIDSQDANRAIVYNWTQDAFTFIDLPDVRSLTVSTNLDNLGGWDDIAGKWGENSDYWSNVSRDHVANSLAIFAAGESDSKIYQMLDSHGGDGSPINAYLEATKIDLDMVLQKPTNTIKHIDGILPQIQGQGVVKISVGSSHSSQDPVKWQAPVTYDIESDYKVDVRINGRYFAIRLESTSDSDFWRLTGLDVDIKEVSGR